MGFRYTSIVRNTRLVLFALICVALPGCAVKTYGLQTTGAGANATVVANQTVATTGFSNGRAAFSFGQSVPPGTQGGQATFGRGGAIFIAVGLMVADALQAFSGWTRPGPVLAQGQPVERISETCSCYQKQ